MIVSAPDGKTIDFGDMPPDQVTGAMQKLYPPQIKPETGDYLQQVAQGGTFGLSDEIGSGLAAGAMALNKGSLNDIGSDYNTGLDAVRSRQNAFEKQNPVTSTALQLVGGIPAALATGGALSSSFGGSNLATRMLANGAAGAASGAAYGFGSGEGEGRLQSAGQGALAGGVLGAAIPIAPSAANAVAKTTAQGAQTFGRGLMARNTEQLQDASSAMFKNASGTYDEMRNAGAVFNQGKSQQIADAVGQAVKSPQFIAELNPKTTAIVNHIQDAAQTGQLSLSDLDQYRRLLSRVGNTEDGVSAGSVRSAIDNEVNNASDGDLVNGDIKGVQLLNQGRGDYAKASRFEAVSDVLQKANGDPNKIKAGLSRFVANDDNLRGFSSAEVSALRNAANTGIGENVLKAFGKFGFDFSKSGTGNTVLPVLSAVSQAAGNPLGVPLTIAGTLARQGQKYIARGKAENVLRMIEQ